MSAASSHGVRTVVVRPALVYGNGGGVLSELVDSARERGAPRYVVGDEPCSGGSDGFDGPDPLWTLVHTADLGDLYARVLANSGTSGGTMVIAAGAGPVPVREIAAEASWLYGSGEAPEPWPLSEARAVLGEYADSLALSQRLSGSRARHMFGWEPSGPTVLEELASGFSGFGGASWSGEDAK